MAKNKPVWAIDIGNTSLKALQCRVGDEPGTIEALAFDYIEHSKILSQPGAEPAELIAESLETFLSRNSVLKNRVAISVSGQNTISRFLKLPPVDKKKLPDIIQLEAKQWLPFALDDVIWDYQPLIGGSMHGNTLVDSEIGMFAIKREFAARAIVPFETVGIPVDCLQSSPLALYNFAAYDQFDLTQLQGDEEGGQKGFNNYTIILCLGTDSSDVVITNGIKIWVRNITIGGNNFTKALTKGMKLTFSNAEHLKRNAATSQDPKAVFQVMRPVFNELLTEVNRSIEFYSSLDRKAKFTRILAMGSPTKLPGLCQFLRQNLGHEVVPLKKYNKLVSEEVLNTPAFAENANSFGICYGLALQMLGEAPIATNLIPTEVVTQRIIANKKPWLLAGAAALMLGFVVPFMSVTKAFTPLQAQPMTSAENAAKSVQTKSSDLKSKHGAVVTNFESVNTIGGTLTSNVEGRVRWPEFYYVLQQALPQNQPGAKLDGILALQDRIYVTNIEVQKVENYTEWWDAVKTQRPGAYILDPIELPEGGAGDAAVGEEGGSESAATAAPAASSTDGEAGEFDRAETGIDRARVPEGGEGNCYIVQMSIYHLHNPEPGMTDEDDNPIDVDFEDRGAAYVRRTLFRNLRHNVVNVPTSIVNQSFVEGTPVKMEQVTMQEYGFSHPVLLSYDRAVEKTIIDPDALDRAVQDAIIKNRTQRILVQTNQKPGRRSPRSGMGGSNIGMYDSNATMTALSPGMNSMGDLARGPNTSILVDLAMSNQGTGGPSGMNSGTSQVLDMVKSLNPDQKLDVRKFEAVVQFVWIPKAPSEREAVKAEKLKAAQEAEAAAAAAEAQAEGNAASETVSDETVVDTEADTTVTEQPTVDTTATTQETTVPETAMPTE